MPIPIDRERDGAYIGEVPPCVDHGLGTVLWTAMVFQADTRPQGQFAVLTCIYCDRVLRGVEAWSE